MTHSSIARAAFDACCTSCHYLYRKLETQRRCKHERDWDFGGLPLTRAGAALHQCLTGSCRTLLLPEASIRCALQGHCITDCHEPSLRVNCKPSQNAIPPLESHRRNPTKETVTRPALHAPDCAGHLDSYSDHRSRQVCFSWDM